MSNGMTVTNSATVILAADRTAMTRNSSFSDIHAKTTESVTHRGSNDDMGKSSATFAEWIHGRGHAIVGPAREVYLTSPAGVAEGDLS